MLKRAARLFWMGVMTLCFSGLAAQTASAHHIILTAAASCDAKNNAVITYTATSWDTATADLGPNGAGANAEIDIFFNGVKVDSGAFNVADAGTFTNTLPAPNGNTSVTVTAQAIDNWGDGFPAADTGIPSVAVQIPQACQTGRFTGGGNDIILANGVKVTQGLELDCDRNPSFNLEVNWAGNHFHLDNFTDDICSFVKNPAPPQAPINTMIGTGTGSYNGVPGYNVLFELVDNGEPGVQDQIAITIFQTGFPPVLSFPLMNITGGNLQAHPDQR